MPVSFAVVVPAPRVMPSAIAFVIRPLALVLHDPARHVTGARANARADKGITTATAMRAADRCASGCAEERRLAGSFTTGRRERRDQSRGKREVPD